MNSLGANWYALAGTAVIAAGAVLHILFALWLTYINRRARGKDRYKVTEKPKDVEWASQNMLVLGIIVVIGIAMHLYQFWFKMQFNEITGILPEVNPHDGYALIAETLGNPIMAIIYLVWFVAVCVPPHTWLLERHSDIGLGTIKFGCRAGNVSPTSTQPFFASDLLW